MCRIQNILSSSSSSPPGRTQGDRLVRENLAKCGSLRILESSPGHPAHCGAVGRCDQRKQVEGEEMGCIGNVGTVGVISLDCVLIVISCEE